MHYQGLSCPLSLQCSYMAWNNKLQSIYYTNAPWVDMQKCKEKEHQTDHHCKIAQEILSSKVKVFFMLLFPFHLFLRAYWPDLHYIDISLVICIHFDELYTINTSFCNVKTKGIEIDQYVYEQTWKKNTCISTNDCVKFLTRFTKLLYLNVKHSMVISVHYCITWNVWMLQGIQYLSDFIVWVILGWLESVSWSLMSHV